MTLSGIGSSNWAAVMLLFQAGFMLNACDRGPDPSERAVAIAYDERLLWSDLRHMIPIDVAPEDSAALADQYIRNWLRQRSVLHQAEINLSESAKDFEAQLKDYRNSLVIYAYEQALVQQKLDTTVHLQEMEEYHSRNAANFELRESVMRVRWAKIRENDKRVLKKLEEHFLSDRTERMHELEMWMAERGISFYDRSSIWSTVPLFHSELGAGTPPPEIDKAGRTVHKDGFTTYFIETVELRMAGEIAPLELVEADIRSMIINQRKLQLLERMREDLYQQALEQQQIAKL